MGRHSINHHPELGDRAAPDEPDAHSVPQTGGTGRSPGHALL